MLIIFEVKVAVDANKDTTPRLVEAEAALNECVEKTFKEGFTVHAKYVGCRPAYREEAIELVPRKVHYESDPPPPPKYKRRRPLPQVVERHVQNTLCGYAVGSKYRTKDKKLVTCKLCLRELGISPSVLVETEERSKPSM